MKKILLILVTLVGLALNANAKVTVNGSDQTFYVSAEAGLYEKKSNTGATDARNNTYPYVTEFTLNHDGNPVTQGVRFEVVQGDASIIKYICATMLINNNKVYVVPSVTKTGGKTYLELRKAYAATGSTSLSNNSVIGIHPTTLSFCLTKVPETPLVIKLNAWYNFMGAAQTTFTGTQPTLTFMAGSPEPDYELGGLIKTTEAHYAGIGHMDLNHNIQWASGALRLTTDESKVENAVFDPDLHLIEAPTEADNTSSTLFVDRGLVDISLVVKHQPDNITSARSAIITVELADKSTGKFATMTANGAPVYYQVTPATITRDTPAQNPTDLKAGTAADHIDCFEWHDGVRTTSSTIAINMGTTLNGYDNSTYRNHAANIVTYVRNSAEAADAETAARIAAGNAVAGTDYVYRVFQPVGLSTSQTGVGNITTDVANNKVKYFNLQGIEVANPTAGNIYIRVENGKASKIIR